MTRAECAHRWRIDEPQGASSRGVCRDCGAARQFRNGFHGDDDGWQGYGHAEQPKPRPSSTANAGAQRWNGKGAKVS